MIADNIFAADMPELLTSHFEQLHTGSGISVDVMRERGYRSVQGESELKRLGFSPAQRRWPGLLLPCVAPDGTNGLYAYKPDVPRSNRDGQPLKYELPLSAFVRLDVPPRCQPNMTNPAIPIWVTEGIKKGDALASQGLTVVTLLGVWNFLGKDQTGSVRLLADFDLISWKGRTVNIVFDNDVMVKPPVRKALDRLTAHLERKGARVTAIYLPNDEVGAKVGVDDYLLHHSVADLEALRTTSRPTPRAPEPMVELLDEAPSILDRPLALIGDQSYAMTWLWVRATQTATLDKKTGEVVTFDTPIVVTSRRPFIVRNDGSVFGEGGTQPLDALGLELKGIDSPPSDHVWRVSGVKAYRAGTRPVAADVFQRVCSVFDHFIDFGYSLADQSVMCEVSACFSLATWFADAFTVLGYPWPNGEKGAGKTNWGLCWVKTSYLGEAVTMGGSFAAIRDLADCGATLLFDDAENINDPKRTDPDKRALLLAGNRKGVRIPLKEQIGDKWVTRWVNAYGPRGFTAIELPDNVLDSRSILIPLVRTNDPRRGNADPANPRSWPCDQLTLQDDLWATALTLLPEASHIWNELDAETSTTGREFEPWRALVAVARLFERNGVPGLETRIRDVMQAYWRERSNIRGDDWSVALIRALARLMKITISDTSDSTDATDTTKCDREVSASEVAQVIKERATSEHLESDWATPTKVGQLLAHFRFKKALRNTAKGTRGWTLTYAHVHGLVRSYGVHPEDGSDSDAAGTPEQVSVVPEASEVSADTDETANRESWEL